MSSVPVADAHLQVYNHASSSLSQAFSSASAAYDYASRAFFNPGMLALLYFPAEHKYAIYTPLFASAMVPLFVAALREFKAWRTESKAT
jgi:GPI-anchor transamidase subunit S